jgi:Peptide methionine sulfoxide reductase
MMERRRLLFRSDLTLDMPIFHSGLLLNSCSVLHPYSQETTESEASDLQQTGIIFPFQVDIATSRYVEKFEWSCGRFVVRGPAKRKFKSLFFPLPSYVIFILAITFCPQTQGGRANVAYFAGGCYWFTEAVFQQAPGVASVKSGYMRNTETIEVTFDPAKTSHDKLLDLFWRAHDPAEIDRQGPDTGKKYRSAIFYVDDQQRGVTGDLWSLPSED